MEHTAYCFGTPDAKYLVVKSYGHAEIVPYDEAFSGKRTLITYTSEGRARQALATRVIHKLFDRTLLTTERWSAPLATKDDLVVLPMKLTLDIPDEK
jgi:hypothetical protein